MTTRTIANLETIHEVRRALRRKANKLRQFEPFTKQQVADFEQLARDYGADRLALVRPVLLVYGQSLIHDHDGYMAALGFDAASTQWSGSRPARRGRRSGRAEQFVLQSLQARVEFNL
ncbi:hypothetical protein D3C78_1271650 [compost metagenome]